MASFPDDEISAYGSSFGLFVKNMKCTADDWRCQKRLYYQGLHSATAVAIGKRFVAPEIRFLLTEIWKTLRRLSAPSE